MKLIEWQPHPPSWWDLRPWWHYHPATEDDPAEFWCGISLFQFRFYV